MDDDEINFLDIVDKAKLDAEKQLQMQDDSELSEFRERVASLQEQTIDKVNWIANISNSRIFIFCLFSKATLQRKCFCFLLFMQKINTEKAVAKPKMPNQSSRPSQRSILAGVVRKRSANDSGDQEIDKTPAKICKTNGNGTPGDDHVDAKSLNNKSNEEVANCNTTSVSTSTNTASYTKMDLSEHDKGALKCIGILPGIGKYRDSSDSEKSTDTDDDYDFSDFDWVGRKVKKNHEDGCQE